MISKKDIISMARQVFRRSQDRQSRELMHPVREWFIGLGAFALVAGAGSLYVWNEFNFYQSLSPEGGQVEMELVSYHEAAAEAAIERFAAKSATYTELVNAEPLAELTPEEAAAPEAATSSDAAATESSAETDSDTQQLGSDSVSGAESDAGSEPEPESLAEPAIGEPIIGE